MMFTEYLNNFRKKTDSFFNAEAQCYDSGKDSQLLLYSDIERSVFCELASQYENKKLFDNKIEDNEFFFCMEEEDVSAVIEEYMEEIKVIVVTPEGKIKTIEKE